MEQNLSRQQSAAESNSTMMTRRTGVVWGSFAAAMTVLVVALSLGERGRVNGFVMAAPGAIGSPEGDAADPITDLDVVLDTDRWSGIVIHHLGRPGGDPVSIERQHRDWGFSDEGGLGYHFVIGNGNGLDDGIIHIGPRWTGQLAGAHVAGPLGEHHNDRSVAICLVGNGHRRQFTTRQIESLLWLVDRLEQELGLGTGSIHFHEDLDGNEAGGPGKFFPRGLLADRYGRLIAR